MKPGTNTLVTSWKTSRGWAIVRDALTIGPRRGEDTVTPHTRPPADEDADHVLVRTVECIEGSVEIELVCEPGFDYGSVLGEWSLSEDRHRADASGAGQTIRLQTDMLIGIEAHHARARHVLHEGEQLYCALSWDEGFPVPTTVEEANAQLAATRRFWRDWLARARIPDHKLGPLIQRSALAIKGLSVYADRSALRGTHHIAPRDAGRGAQLGLPLHLDARFDVHAPGAALSQPRLGGQ